jgi:hypothetical protein
MPLAEDTSLLLKAVFPRSVLPSPALMPCPPLSFAVFPLTVREAGENPIPAVAGHRVPRDARAADREDPVGHVEGRRVSADRGAAASEDPDPSIALSGVALHGAPAARKVRIDRFSLVRLASARRSALLGLGIVPLAGPALTAEGLLEIDQTCAVLTGCFPGGTTSA